MKIKDDHRVAGRGGFFDVFGTSFTVAIRIYIKQEKTPNESVRERTSHLWNKECSGVSAPTETVDLFDDARAELL